MGKTWLSFATCFSSTNDKNYQKPKKKWFGKQKSIDSIALIREEIPSIEPSNTAPPPQPPSPPPQPLLPPPSPPPPPPPLRSKSAPRPISAANVDPGECNEEETRQALALATAVAAEAAVVAAHAAAEVVRLATATRQTGKSNDESAAIKIQTAYRGYMARRTLRALRGMTRLKELLQGQYVKRQATAMLRSMQTLTRLQTQIQERRIRLSEENMARHRLLQQRQPQKVPHATATSLIMAGEFDVSNKTKEQIKARLQFKKEAAVRRERALAYAYSHQRTWRNSSKLPHQTLMDPNNPHWGWSWLERWMASRPWDAQIKAPYSDNDQTSVKSSVKSSFNRGKARPKMRKTVSQGVVDLPVENNSKYLQMEQPNRRRSLGGGVSLSVIKDDESVGSSSTFRSSFGPMKAAANSRITTATASNLSSQRKKSVDDQNRQVVLAKKRFSGSASSRTITRTLSDSDKATVVPNGEKRSKSRGGSK